MNRAFRPRCCGAATSPSADFHASGVIIPPLFCSLLPIPVPWTAHVERPHGLPKLPESAFLFHRIDPSRNMLRFYQLELLPDMLGGVLLIREWSRIGSRGQYKARWFDDPAAANPALFTQARRKERRGYAPSAG
jgi:predicted DNA-binding WGR domain protein